MKYSKLLPYTILLVSVSSITQWCELPIGNTYLWWCLQAFILFLFVKLMPAKQRILPVKCFLAWLAFSAVYGACFQTENYWDWKLLVSNLMIFSLPVACYTYSRPIVLQRTLRVWLQFAWIILLLLVPFLSSDAFGRFLVPCSFLTLFLPLLNKRLLFISILAYIITITLGSASRSDMLKFSVTIAIGVTCFLLRNRYGLVRNLVKTVSLIFFIAPFFFFVLGITGVYNVFELAEESGLEGKYTQVQSDGDEIDLLADTRTFLYVEEISSAIKYDYYIVGHSIARGYESEAFGKGASEDMKIRGRYERQSCETSILNVFNYFGLVGVGIYLFVFVAAVYTALKESRNIYILFVALYVAFRWLFAWIEDFSKFDLNYLFLWIMIGMCFSPYYLSMSNKEFSLWFQKTIR